MKRAMRWLGGLVLAGLFATSVSAAPLYVSAGGRPGTAGATKADALGSTFLANTAAVPGQTIRMLPGLYAGPDSLVIRPDSAGHSPIGAGIIEYSGVETDGTTLNTSGTVTINSSLTVNTPYTYLTNLHVVGDLTLGENADRCRLINCTVDGNTYINGADYTTFDTCTLRGGYWKVGTDGFPATRDSFVNCTLPSLGGGVATGCTYPIMFGLGSDPITVDSCAVMFPTITMTAQLPLTPPLVGSCQANNESWTEIFRHTTHLTWRGAHETVNVPAGTHWVRRFRDDSHTNRIDCDTLVATGAGAADFWLATSGNTGVAFPADNDIDSSLYNFMGAGSSNGLYFQVTPNGTNVTYTTVLGHSHALYGFGAIASTFNHDTFVGDGADGVVRWEYNNGNPTAFRGAPGLTFTNNIVDLLSPYTLSQPISPYASQGGTGRVCVYYEQAVMDSANKLDLQTTLHADNNAYSYWGDVTTVGDRSLVVRDPNLVTYGKPGDNQPVEARYNQVDSLSVFGSMQFADSTDATTFNPRPGHLSVALGKGSSSSDVGAVAYEGYAHYSVLSPTVDFFYGVPATATVSIVNEGDGDGTFDCAAFPTQDWTAYNVYPDYDLLPSCSDGEIGAGITHQFTITYHALARILPGTYHILIELTNDPTLPTQAGTGGTLYPYVSIPVTIH